MEEYKRTSAARSTGKLAVVAEGLTDRQRDAIREAAELRGFSAAFFENAEDAREAAEEAEILFSVSAELAGLAPHLKWQCCAYAGVNQFREGCFASPDAVLTNSSGAYGVTIAEHIVMVTLEILRRQQEYSDIVARRGWNRTLPVRSVFGSRILMLGTGDIGQEAAKRLRAFQPACITGVNSSGRNQDSLFDCAAPAEELPDLLPRTDLLIMSLPGTEKTVRIMDADRLAMLPDGAVIVNVGRGSCIEEAALEAELRKGRLYAALDVFEKEPLPADSSLWNCPNLLLTPHVAGNMTLPYTVEKIVEMFLENFRRYCEGEPLLRQVDLKKGY